MTRARYPEPSAVLDAVHEHRHCDLFAAARSLEPDLGRRGQAMAAGAAIRAYAARLDDSLLAALLVQASRAGDGILACASRLVAGRICEVSQ